jgi:hypothetical protein
MESFVKMLCLVVCVWSAWAFARKAAEKKEPFGSFRGQRVLSFSQKFNYDCALITKDVVKKVRADTKCTKKVWETAAPNAAPYYECETASGALYISGTSEHCAQMRNWLQVD